MSHNTLRVERTGIRGIVENICLNHKRISQFKIGADIEGIIDAEFPLAFYETGHPSQTNGEAEIHNIVLVIADYISEDASEEEIEQTLSYVDQTISEIHHKLQNYNKRHFEVSDIFKLPARNVSDDKVCGIRGEFTVRTARYISKLDLPFNTIGESNLPTPQQITSFSGVYSVQKNIPLVINHNLNAEAIIAQFYINDVAVLAAYSITNNNTITLDSAMNVAALKVVITKI